MAPDGTVLGSVTFALPGSRWARLSRPGEAEFRALGFGRRPELDRTPEPGVDLLAFSREL